MLSHFIDCYSEVIDIVHAFIDISLWTPLPMPELLAMAVHRKGWRVSPLSRMLPGRPNRKERNILFQVHSNLIRLIRYLGKGGMGTYILQKKMTTKTIKTLEWALWHLGFNV